MNTPTQTPLTDAEEYAKHVIAHLCPDHSSGARLVQIALGGWLNRHLATLRRERDALSLADAELGIAKADLFHANAERDELRAELLTTHQMACRVGLERDELAKLLGEAADELAVPGYDAPPISKGVQNLLSRIRAALQSLRALTEQPGKP